MKIQSWLALCCVLAAGAARAAMPGEDSASGALAAAQTQLQAGDYPAVRATLAPLLATAEPHLEALFLSGMAALAQQDYAAAIAHFRAMLTRNPSLIRPRLELARALQSAGEREAARYHYEQVLSAGLPEPVARNVMRQLGRLREREPQLRMTLELTSDSNPAQATSARTVTIGGLPYTLRDSGRTGTVYGVRAAADLYWPLPSDPAWYARFYLDATEYPRRHLDALYAQASLGRRFEIGAHHAALEAGGHVSSYQDRAQYAGGLLRATGFYRLSPKLALTAEAQVKTYAYERLRYLDGENLFLGLTGIVVPSPGQRWDLGAGVNVYAAAEPAYSYTQPSVSARFVQEWPGGWITGARLSGLVSTYDAPDVFFGATRKDREGRVEFDVRNRRLNWRSFTPQAALGYVKRDSNLDLYAYDRFYGRFGLTREF